MWHDIARYCSILLDIVKQCQEWGVDHLLNFQLSTFNWGYCQCGKNGSEDHLLNFHARPLPTQLRASLSLGKWALPWTEEISSTHFTSLLTCHLQLQIRKLNEKKVIFINFSRSTVLVTPSSPNEGNNSEQDLYPFTLRSNKFWMSLSCVIYRTGTWIWQFIEIQAKDPLHTGIPRVLNRY